MKFERNLPLGASSMGQYAEEIYDRLGGLRAILEAVPAAIYTTDAEGRITSFNDEAVRFAGRVPQLGSDSWCVTWKLYCPNGTPLPHDQCPMAIALREGRPVRGISAIAERPDGTRVHFMPYPTPIKDASGKVIGAVNMLVDITEQKGAEHLFGYSAAEALGESVALIVPEERRAEELELMARIARGEVVMNFETVRRAKDGRSFDISLTASPIRD